MAYIALPTRDSSFILLANAAPRLPRGSRVTASATCSLVDGAAGRAMRVHAASPLGANASSRLRERGRRMFASVEGSVTVEEPAVSAASEGAAEEKGAAEEGAAAGEGAGSSDAPAKRLQRSGTVKRPAAGAKREITVTTEQLVVGTVFTGKVRAIQSYGAFVDIGAFTDGLVHISQLSSEYVKEVGDVVTVGQEVSVTVVELNEKAGRIALSMRDKESEAEQQASRGGGEVGAGSGAQGDGGGKPANRGKIAGRGGGSARAGSRANDERKATKLKKGQELKGTVKNIIRNGAFVEFAEEGEEGFLRGSEITEGGENVAVDSLLTVGQEVTVRVLKIERGKAALTMKAQVDMTSINDSLNTNVGGGGASNPFATFFRSANLIPATIRGASVDAGEEGAAPAVVETPAEENTSEESSVPAVEETAAVLDTPAEEKASELEETSAPEVKETAAVLESPAEEQASELKETLAPAAEETAAVVENLAEEKPVKPEETLATAVEETAAVLETPAEEKVSEQEETSAPAVEETAAVLDTPAEEKASKPEETSAPAVEETAAVEQASEPEEASAPASASAEAAPALESPAEEKASDPEKSLASALEGTAAVLDTPAEEKAFDPEETSATSVLESVTEERASESKETSGPAVEKPDLEVSSSTEAVRSEDSPPAEESKEEPHSLSLGEIAEGIGGVVAEIEKVAEAAAEFLNVGDDGKAAEAERAGASSTPGVEETEARAEPAETVGDAEVSREPEVVTQAAAEAPVAEEPKAEVAPVAAESKAASGPTAAQVKALREKSGAGMMECKKALVACGNDVSKASEYLRKKGLAGAEKKSSRIAAEGRVGSYVHDGRMGVLIEINCETDFVSRGSEFKELVADMGMQVVACPDVRYVSVDDVPAEFVQKEREIETGKEDLARKPAQIREKIVEGRIAKRLSELALLEQAYIRDDKKPVRDVVKESTAKLGEKVQIRRFVRFNLGEGIQKKSVDFAAEVAAQTAAKADAKPVAEAPKVDEAKQEAEAPKVAVSAASVKELRQATGAGMMDCKKALAACENDVAKATDYLRKKGLASADKKSGRVASEGLVGSYIHDGRIGVLVEVNSETDFVARSAQFKELVGNIGMQVAACPQVQFVSVDEIPAAFVAKEKEIEMGKEDLAKRPEAVRGKIVEGRVAKTLKELALLEQPYIRDDKMLVKEYVKQTVAALGENIQVRRFARFNLGEGIEKRSTDFAAEVAAAQTGAKA